MLVMWRYENTPQGRLMSIATGSETLSRRLHLLITSLGNSRKKSGWLGRNANYRRYVKSKWFGSGDTRKSDLKNRSAITKLSACKNAVANTKAQPRLEFRNSAWKKGSPRVNSIRKVSHILQVDRRYLLNVHMTAKYFPEILEIVRLPSSFPHQL